MQTIHFWEKLLFSKLNRANLIKLYLETVTSYSVCVKTKFYQSWWENWGWSKEVLTVFKSWLVATTSLLPITLTLLSRGRETVLICASSWPRTISYSLRWLSKHLYWLYINCRMSISTARRWVCFAKSSRKRGNFVRSSWKCGRDDHPLNLLKWEMTRWF